MGDGLYSVYPILEGDYKLIIKNNKKGQLGEVPYEHTSQDFINLFKELGTNTQSEKNLTDSVETITQEKFNKSLNIDKLNQKLNDPEKNLFSGDHVPSFYKTKFEG